MSDDKSISLVHLDGKFSEPANTLIKKVSSAVGGLFEPWQIKRVAKAQAKAELIKAESEIEIDDLRRRAICRWIGEEAQRQENMESITMKAVPQLNKGSNPNNMENDWITNFFDKSRIVSDAEMQGIWAKVLAGEANAPGTFSKRTVNFLGEIDKRDAELFQNLCSFGWIIEDFKPLVFDPKAEIYNQKGIDFDSLTHLDSIGLIQFHGLTGFSQTDLPKFIEAVYYGYPLKLEMPKEDGNNLSVGMALLTQVGQELVNVCKASGVDGFVEYVKEQWKQFLPKKEEAEQGNGGNA